MPTNLDRKSEESIRKNRRFFISEEVTIRLLRSFEIGFHNIFLLKGFLYNHKTPSVQPYLLPSSGREKMVFNYSSFQFKVFEFKTLSL